MSMTTYLTLKVLLVLLLCVMQHVHSEEKKKQKQKIDKIVTTTKAITIISVEEEEEEENATETPVSSFTTATATTTTNEFISVGKESRKKEASAKAEKNAPETETETENTIYDLYEWLRRYKRPQMKMIQQQQHQHNLQLNLPSAPLLPPPPFSHNFALSPFKSYGSLSSSLSSSSSAAATTNFNFKSTMVIPSNRCGGILKAQHGIIQTPNFPHKFATPLECIWIIDAGDFLLQPQSQNTSIVVYLTQLYVLGGIKFTEYMYYSDDYKVPAHRVFTLTEDDVTQVAWIQFNSPYLEIRFQLATLDGTHLRALDRLLDVYGFNITYEVAAIVKSYQCNTLQCRFLGHCFAQWNFSSYYCSCFAGFSGIDCGYGPLCSDPHTNICQNGGTCKHIGDAAVTCHCPVGFKGTKCEIPDISEETLGCTANSSAATCHRQCAFNHTHDIFSPLRTSKTYARSGKTRYEVTIRLSTNLTAFYSQLNANDNDSKRINNQLHLSAMLEKHLSRVLRNFNITKISDLELISNRLDRLDITFHFFGIKTDSNRIREAIIRMVERGRIGNITLVSNYHLFDENPPLNLMDLSLNNKPPIREDSEFVLSCTAQGSQRMLFQWYKDGVAVNASKATREIWSTVLPPETKDVFTAILGITRATRLDEGIYTCKVTDWDVEQCRSMYVHIKSPPRLRVDPASVTLHKGDSLRVRCLSPANEDIKRYAQLGYSWTRNGILFQSDPKTVMWEDLYPDGSILKINNIQKSAEYSCIVSNSVKPVIKSVYITVIDVEAVHVCHADTVYGVRWPTSAPGGAAVVAECPRRFEGFAKRVCEKRDSGNSSWLVPDYSNCVRDQLLTIYKKFHSLIAGFQQTNTSELLVSCWHYTIKWWKHFLPGEASSLINMLHELDDYLQIKGTQLEREMAAEIILHILDKVMQNTQSLNNQQQINKLQLLTQSAALNRETIAASQLATSTTTGAGAAYIRKAQASSSSSASSLSSLTTTSTVTSSSLSSPAVSAENVDSFTILSGAATFEFSSDTGLSSTRNIAAVHENNQLTIATKAKTKPASAKTDSISQQGSNGGIEGNTAVSASSNMAGHNSILTVDEDSLSLERLNSLRIFMTSIKTLPFNLRIYGDDLFSDQLYMDIGYSQRLLHVMANNTVFAAVISYKNLKSFLPKTYYSRGSDSQDSDYVLASRIIQTWLFQANRSNDNLRVPLDLPFEFGHVEIIFQHEHTPKDGEWEAVCGHDYKATFESTWRSDLCITKNLMENITRCVCPISGTYVVMLTKRISHIHHVKTRPRPVFVIISCIGCLLQSCSAFITLLPIWYNRHCAVTFLKMQFCFSTFSIMIVYLLGFLKTLPLHWQPVISSSLASLLLLGISTLIAIALVIHTELVAKKLLHLNNMTTKATAIITRSTAAATTTNSTSDTLGIIVRTKKEPTFRPQHQLDKCANKAASPTPPSCIKMAREIRTPNPTSPTITVKTASNISVSNITQISTSSSNDVNSTRTNTLGTSNNSSGSTTTSNYQEHQLKQMRSHQYAEYTKQQQFKPLPLGFSTQAGVSGAIVISWLLPLLYAIAVPLICTINGKWPQNWWIEVISRTAISSKSSTTHQTENSDTNILLPRGTSFTSNLNKHFRQAFNKISSYTTTYQSLLSDGDSKWEFNVNKKHSRTTTNINATFNLSNYKTNITEKISTATTTSVPSSVTGPLLNNFKQEFFYNATDEPEPQSISLNFLIFVCVDVVFVVSFFGLFGILIKKFLWLWHKHCDAGLHSAISHSNSSSPQKTLTYDLDKFHNNIQERIGLLYRLLGLLFIKLSVDTLFIVYSNAQNNTSWWSYPFGLACILLGFAVLSCFILKPECQLYNRHLSAASRSSKQTLSSSACGTLKTKTKLNSSKTSLEDNNYSSGAINTSINFYASHEKEKESESAAPLMLSLTTMPSLTTLTAQSMELQGTAGCQLNGFTMLSTAAAAAAAASSSDGHMLSQEQLQQQQFLNHYLTQSVPVSYNVCLPPTKSLQSLAAPAATSASHCYNVLGGNRTNMITSSGGADLTPLVVGSTLTYYDAYTNLNIPVACQLASFNGCTTTTAEANLSLHDFVGLETLDILQGVGVGAGKYQTNAVSGICSTSYQHSKLSQQQQQTVDRTDFIKATQTLNPTAMSSLNGLTANVPTNISDAAEASKVAPKTKPYSNSIITTTSATTQTPKTQKSVTIREPTTHTFDPLLPTMVAIAGVNMPQSHQQQIHTPIITITNASLGDGSGHIDLINGRADNEISGNADAVMLDRISHDLNYLLNGSEESKKETAINSLSLTASKTEFFVNNSI